MEISGFVYCHNIVAAGLSLFCKSYFIYIEFSIILVSSKLNCMVYRGIVNNVDNCKRIFVIFQTL